MEQTLEGSAPGEDSANARTIVEPGDRRALAPHRPLRIGRFIVLEELGRGGMGIVYAAYDPDLDRKVAVKVLQARDEATEQTHEDRARLLREAQAMARLSHPHVATVHEVGTTDDRVFLAMEFIAGRTLTDWVAEIGLAQGWPAILPVFRQAGEGLAAAHRAGLVHRDFKPDNVLVDGHGRAKVLDFGLARTQRTPPAPPTDDPTAPLPLVGSDLDTSLTMVGQVMGTPAYMAPEQFVGERVDARSDQFSFCVALYEALYGERPFVASTFEQLRHRVLRGGPPVPPDDASVPGWLLRILLRGLALHPAERYDTMEELLEALGRDPGRRRRRLAWGLSAGVLLTAGAVAGYVRVQSEIEQARTLADPCAQSHEGLHGIWDPARKRAIREAFTQTEVEYAEGTWSRIQDRLDDYAARWVKTQQAVCRATEVDHTQSEELRLVRQACLNRRRSELRAHTAVFARADPQVVQGAVAGIDALREPEACRTVQTMRIEMPLPADEAAASRVARLRQRLDDVMALITSGQRNEALTVAEQVVAEAEGLAYLPFVAEARLKLGITLDKKGRYDEAEQTLGAALSAAEVGRHDAAAVDAWNQWLRTVGYHQGRHEVARATLPRLDAALRRLGDDPIREADAAKTRGTLAYAQGDFASAVRHFAAGKELLERELGPDHSQTAILYQNLGTALQRVGRYDEAEQVLEQGLRIWSAHRGSLHPGLAAIHESLGNVELDRGRADAAVEHFELALTLFMQSHDALHPEVALRHRELGLALAAQGRPAEAIDRYRQALEAERARLGRPEPPFESSLLLGRALIEQGRSRDAVPVLEEVLAHPEATGFAQAEASFTLARALWTSAPGQRGRARRLATQAAEGMATAGYTEQRATIVRWLAAPR